MKIIFFGLGSIGKRHAKILLENYDYTLYALRSGVDESLNELGMEELYSWDEVEKIRPNVAFITNPTSFHIETAIKCANLNYKLFIEKPIGKDMQQLDKLIALVENKSLTTYVAYCLRFHPVIKKLKEYVKQRKPLHVRVVCSSYLPNWRPGQDFLKSYSANSAKGGGVILDLSHELDYIYYLLGEISTIEGTFSKKGQITVDAEDNADMFFSADGVPVSIHIDFLSQRKERYIQMDFEKLTVVGDLINHKIEEYENEILRKSYETPYIKGQEYQEQMEYFFDNIDNNRMMNNLIEAADLFKKISNFKTNKYE